MIFLRFQAPNRDILKEPLILLSLSTPQKWAYIISDDCDA